MRKDNWFEALTEVISKHNDLPFTFGVSDCACFVADAVEAMTCENIYKERPDSAEAVKKFLAKNKMKSPADFVAKKFREIEPSFARNGDIAILDTAEGEACGVFIGAVILAKDKKGLSRSMRRVAKRAFEVV